MISNPMTQTESVDSESGLIGDANRLIQNLSISIQSLAVGVMAAHAKQIPLGNNTGQFEKLLLRQECT
jgi:hypothetical protein